MNQITEPVTIEEMTVSSDHRGTVFNPLPVSALTGQKNFHMVISQPRAVRGNHYHRRGTEILIVAGPATVRIRENGRLRDIVIPGQSIYRLTIAPGISHAVKHTGPDAGFLLAFNTVAYDPENPDVVRDILL